MGEAAALASALTWSCSSVALASLSARTAPAVLSALRLACGSFILVLLLFATGEHQDYKTLGLLGFGGLILSGLLADAFGDTIYIRALGRFGIQRTFPVVQATFILLSVAGGILILDEPAGWGLVLGAALIGIGIFFVVTHRAVSSAEQLPMAARTEGAGELELQPRPGQRFPRWPSDGLWLLPLVGFTWAAATLLLAKSRGDLGAIAAGTLRTPAGAISLLLFAALFQRTELALPFHRRSHIAAIAAAGIVGTALGSMLYVYAVINAGAARTVVLSSTAPLMAVPLSIIFLGERFSRRRAAGTLLCVLGVIVVVS